MFCSGCNTRSPEVVSTAFIVMCIFMACVVQKPVLQGVYLFLSVFEFRSPCISDILLLSIIAVLSSVLVE